MPSARRDKRDPGARDGQILPLFAAVMVVLLTFCVLTIDVGRMVTARAQLQNAVDAAALAGASQLVGFVDEDAKDAADAEARRLAAANIVLSTPLTLGADDVQFGRYVPGPPPGFIPESELPSGSLVDSVKVTGRRTADSPDGDIPLLFGGLFGISASAQEVRAIATQPRRYVMFVMDRSGSMMWDATDVDLRQTPNPDGSMDPSPTGWYWVPRRIHTGSNWQTAWFYALNNETGEIETDFLPEHIRSRLLDGQYFRYRDRDRPNTVQSGWIWAPDNVTLYSAYGPDHLNWDAQGYRPLSQSAYGLATVPVQAMAASQDAAAAFVDLLNPEQTRAGLVTYGWSAIMEQELTADFEVLKEKIHSYDPRGATATTAGMRLANDEFIHSGRAEAYGQRIMILLTDGMANCIGGTYHNNPNSDIEIEFLGDTVQGRIYQNVADSMAVEVERARNNGIRIYAISFSSYADEALMPLKARATGGAYYYSEDHETLTDIFVDIFYKLPPILTH